MRTAAPAAIPEAVARVDGLAKVTGTARFVDDLDLPGALHGATVRANVPHGLLRELTLDPAFDWTGVVLVTADDVPGRNVILCDTDDQPALVAVGGEVRHVGEAVALVAAPTPARARAAAAHVEISIDPLPAVLTIEAALACDVVLGDADNRISELHLERGDVDDALAAADLVIEGTYRTGPVEHGYLEPQGMTAEGRADGSLHVAGSMQCPGYVQAAVAAATGLPPERVVVVQAVTGGGFGGKEDYPSTVAVHAALLAAKTGRPVKLVYPRREDLLVTTKRHPALIHHRFGFAGDGRLVAADVEIVLDGGAYVTLSPLVLLRACVHATGPYRVPAARIRGRVVFTNHPPSGAYRGFGAPQAHFAAERQMARAARSLGVDPLELRRRNALRPGDATVTGGILDESAGLPEVLEALAGVLGTPAARGRRATGPVLRGRGIAAAFHGAGFSGGGEDRLGASAAVVRRAGGGFEVLVTSAEIGQGATTVLAQIAAAALEVPVEQVRVPPADTSRAPESGPTVASRTTMVVGRVVEEAARELRARLFEGEGGAGGEVVVTATYEPPPGPGWDDVRLTGVAYPSYGWSACAVEVAVDRDTSEVTVERCVQIVDCGRAVNRAAVRGQIEGGTVQALGWALSERCVRDGGHLRSTDLATIALLTAREAPEIEAVVVEVPYRHGPFGAKGIGELPMDAPAAAVANAIEDALGVAADELPLLPEVVDALRGDR